ncbi:MAG: hypothetical protein M1269_11130 [Chloroflexi bacterium]|nr:hypothetical protein [Chloroflexota bacterium]
MNWDKNIKNRLWRTLAIFLTIAVFLSAALFNAQILKGQEYKQLAKVQRTDRIRSLYLRGSIYDRNRNLLAESTNRPSLAAHPYRMRNPRLVGRVLSNALNLDEKKIIEILTSPPEVTEVKRNVDLKMQQKFALAKKRFPTALKGIFLTPVGDGTSLPSLVANPDKIRDRRLAAKLLAETMGFKEKETFENLRNINKFVYLSYKMSYNLENKFKIAKEKYRLQLKDVFAVEEESGKRIYPKGTLAGHIMGFSGFDDKGMSGVELSFNPQLKGGASYALAEVDPLGRLLPGSKILRKPGATSLNLVLTIDEYIQYQAERELLAVPSVATFIR